MQITAVVVGAGDYSERIFHPERVAHAAPRGRIATAVAGAIVLADGRVDGQHGEGQQRRIVVQFTLQQTGNSSTGQRVPIAIGSDGRIKLEDIETRLRLDDDVVDNDVDIGVALLVQQQANLVAKSRQLVVRKAARVRLQRQLDHVQFTRIYYNEIKNCPIQPILWPLIS